MKIRIGDLIRWENTYNEYELGVVTEVYPKEAKVWFFIDHDFSIMRIRGLEVVNESR